MSLNIEAVFGEKVYRFDIPDNQSIDLLTRKFSAEFFKSSLEKEGIFVNENFITKFIGMLSGKTRNKINPSKCSGGLWTEVTGNYWHFGGAHDGGWGRNIQNVGTDWNHGRYFEKYGENVHPIRIRMDG